MEYESIEREIHIEASPEVVFEVVSSPRHLREWWPDEAEFAAVPGEAGRIGFGDPQNREWMQFTVVEAVPPRLFSFRWTHREGNKPPRGTRCWSSSRSRPPGAGRCCG
ncbi:SRPBCC family protein [Actinomadura madurae]|uniref:SRPBCC family protein n=1 Tax=Actinomadura madurae TaxID=1993 RepID=UPI0020D25C32|nr:SRPBCC family protein [Actinomadura madurae]MCP9978998.1 SRPBCC family protein [Actinomadura madurae]MCQ0015183.1 SRPBCC family protein [Actinomadura madurae]